MYAPERVLTNADLERLVDTSDEWIRTRTGIRERRVAAPHETTATLAAVAGKRAIAVAGLEPDDIDLILVATLTPDYWMPSTAVLVKEAIGNRPRGGLGRRGRLLGLRLSPTRRPTPTSVAAWPATCCVIGAELLTRFLDFTDRSTCILFGDGAGAVVLSASDEEGGGLGGLELTTDPDGAYMIWLPSGGSRARQSRETIAARRALHPHGGPRDVPLRDQDPGHLGAHGDRARPAGHPTRSTSSSRTRPTSASSSRWPRASASRWRGCS